MRLDTAMRRTGTIFMLSIVVIIVVLILPSKEYFGIKITSQVAKDTSLDEAAKQVESGADAISGTQTSIGTHLLNFILKNPLLTFIMIFLCVITGVASGWIGKLRGLIK